MKKLFPVIVFVILIANGCKKEPYTYSGSPVQFGTLPYEDKNFKLEFICKLDTQNVRDLFFINENIGFIINDEGDIFKTIDKGISWNKKTTNSPLKHHLLKIFFSDSLVGYIVGKVRPCFKGDLCEVSNNGAPNEGGIIFKTIDGGETWNNIYQNKNYEFVSGGIDSRGSVFVVGNRIFEGRILQSKNKGISWFVTDSTNYNINKIVFDGIYGFHAGREGHVKSNRDTCYAVCTDKCNDTCYLKWDSKEKLEALNVSDLDFKFNQGLCVIDFNQLLKVSDDRKSWNLILNSEKQIYKVNILSNESWFLFGQGNASVDNHESFYGSMLYTLNAGGIWNEIQFKDLQEIRVSSLYNSKNGYLISGLKLIKFSLK